VFGRRRWTDWGTSAAVVAGSQLGAHHAGPDAPSLEALRTLMENEWTPQMMNNARKSTKHRFK